MKVSLKWLKDYVKIPKDLALSKIIQDLTMSTVEVEGTTELSPRFDKIVIGMIKEVLPHPNADKLKICKTDIGNDIKEIVCGGINLSTNMKVAVALPGALVRWHGEGELIEIGITKVRDVESYGMICAATEIGLTDLFSATHEAEIIDLSEIDAKAGTPIAVALELDDTILEIDNKSLTNRPDLWGHYGIARELSAIYDLPFNEILPFKDELNKGTFVEIADSKLCPRYIGLKMNGLSIKPSSFEIQKRLWSVGLRPINAIVDITNYVMLTTGQPTHAFDADNIKGSIAVRLADNEEKLILLNKAELELTKEDLVITDERGPVGLAGIMGGEIDSVLPTTDKVILEIANFSPMNIRKTAIRYETRTEAAIRFEKGIDPERCDLALTLSIEMFKQNFPELSIIEFQDNYPRPSENKSVAVSLSWLEKRLGKKIANDEIESILSRLGFKVDFNGDIMSIVIPSWRATGDISIPNDILEEIARIHGFENFEPVPISTTINGAINQLDLDLDRKIREYLAFRCGMQEIYTYPWVNNEYLKAIFNNSDGMLSLSTPPTPDEKFIRCSLIPNLCKAVTSNLRFTKEFSLFESAQIFFDRDFEAKYDSKELLPLQFKFVAGAYVSERNKLEANFRNVKGIIEALPHYIHIEAITLENNEKPIWADDKVWLNITFEGEIIGNIALLSNKAALECGIKNSAVLLFEMNIDALKPLPSRTNKFTNIPEYPLVDYDLSLLFERSVKWTDILKVIKDSNNSEDILRDVSFVGEYKGQQVPENKKSITLRLVIGSLNKTLTSNEIENYANTIITNLKDALGGELR